MADGAMSVKTKTFCVFLLFIGVCWPPIVFAVRRTLPSIAHTGCHFYPSGEYLRFVRVPENLRIGEEVLLVEVHPRGMLQLRPMDKGNDAAHFAFKEVNRTHVALTLAQSLEDLVDTDNPQNVLKFRLACEYHDGEDVIASSLSVTVYVEDINDHAPVFEGAPYDISVDELTPVGLTVFRGIHATDRDKPNTPNSDVQYAITAGNERAKFALDSSHQALLVLRRPLDFDAGDRDFQLTLTASDRGLPPRATTTIMRVRVVDNDDLSPKFTKGVYRTRVTENYPITGEKLRHLLIFEPKIFAYDQDVAINSPIRYDIIAGNDRRLFELDSRNGSLYLQKEIDLEAEKALPGNTFVLQIQATQLDNPLKTGVARVEVEVMDVNDNLPEFEADAYNISIVENLPNGFSVLQIIAHDHDQGDNAEFAFQLEDKSRAFSLDARTGWLSVRNQSLLDREQRASIQMRVYAVEKTASVAADKESASYVNVAVTLLDANDNNPVFVPNHVYDFQVQISDGRRRHESIGRVHAVDPDLGTNGLVHYFIQKAANASYPFRIDMRTGELSLAPHTNRSVVTEGRHLLFVEAVDQPLNPSERRTALAVVTIDMTNSNSNNYMPTFVGAPYEFWVGGNVDIGTSVGQIRLANVDKSKGGLMYDLLHSYHEGVPFAVEERSGTITVINSLRSFDRVLYDFEGVVSNSKGDLSIVTNVTIHVVDPKDKNLFLKGTLLEFHIKENQPANQAIGRVASGNSTTQRGLKFYIANQQDVTDHIAIHANGTLFTQQALDRERRDTYRLTIIAESQRGFLTGGAGIYQAVVIVDDENDNAPQFEQAVYEGRIRENQPIGSEVSLNSVIRVSDADAGANGQFGLLLHGDGADKFRLDRFTGKLYFNAPNGWLDREERSRYQLQLVAKDKGGLKNETLLIVHIDDVNDNAPVFQQLIVPPGNKVRVQEYDEHGSKLAHLEDASLGIYSLPIQPNRIKPLRAFKAVPIIYAPEDLPMGSAVLQVVAADRDAGGNAVIKYEMLSETYIPNVRNSDPFHVSQYFMVHPTSGEVYVSRSLPAASEFRINLTATDIGSLRDFLQIRIFIEDVNNHPPVFRKSGYNFNAEEALFSRDILGKIEAIDGDFGQNANISYKIHHANAQAQLPFKISEFSGVLSVDGELDREVRDKYLFAVVAKDNPLQGKRFSASVGVEVNVIDVNDNAPMFYGYDDVIVPKTIKQPVNHQTSASRVPVYFATVAENSPIGTPVMKVYANDSDFLGNGNGLILFDVPYKKNRENLFAIDSKDGRITTMGQLDYERARHHNVTIVASDLGSPSLSATALLMVTVIDVVEEGKSTDLQPVFAHRYYEVEVEENVPVPLKILTLNITDAYQQTNHSKSRYSIVQDVSGMFHIDPKNGSLYVTVSPDREQRALYELKVRLDHFKVGRDMTAVVYPVPNDRLGDLDRNEVKVIVRITDVNDNVPRFTQMVSGRPIVAAIPTTAHFGHQVVQLYAVDPDLGLNGDVRYQILGRPAADYDEVRKFAIDAVTGQVRAIASFTRDAGKVYGFDVKATDRRGADDGASSIANVFVYVLDEDKQLVMVMGSRPTDIERNMDNITEILHNATGFDVRVRKLEPHFDRNQVDNSATDMYLYAVDPKLNTVVEMRALQEAILHSQPNIERQLKGQKVIALASGAIERIRFRSQRVVLSTFEVGVVVLGCVVFIGALATAVCVVCLRRRKNRRLLQKRFPLGFPISPSTVPKRAVSAPFCDGPAYTIDRMLDADVDVRTSGFHPHQQFQRHHHIHHPSCPRARFFCHKERSRSLGAMEQSIASLHSSGKDSGIDGGGGSGMPCHCGLSTSHSSAASSNGYEDSLQSISPRCRQSLRCDTYINHPARPRRRSLSEELILGAPLHRIASHTHLAHPSAHRQSSEQLIMSCPLSP